VEKKLDAILRQQRARHVPGDLGLLVLDEAACHRLRITSVDLCTRGAGGPEGYPAELQARRRGFRPFLDQSEAELLLLLVTALIQNLETVHNGAGRADQVVADP